MLNAVAKNPTLAFAQIGMFAGADGRAVVRKAGRIAGVRPAAWPLGAADPGDALPIPGKFVLHTDHIKTHVFGGAGAEAGFPFALTAHAGVVITGGTTTVLGSLCFGRFVRRPAARNLQVRRVATLEKRRTDGLFRADHLLHLRCRLCDPDTVALADTPITSSSVRLVSELVLIRLRPDRRKTESRAGAGSLDRRSCSCGCGPA